MTMLGQVLLVTLELLLRWLDWMTDRTVKAKMHVRLRHGERRKR